MGKRIAMALLKHLEEIQPTHVFVAVLGVHEFTDANFQLDAIGYILPGNDQADLIRTLEDLQNGRQPTAEARRVNVHLLSNCTNTKEHRLSPRELDVLRALVDGLSNKMIAAELHISFETVRSHMKCIYQKLKVNNNTAAVAKAIHSGLVTI